MNDALFPRSSDTFTFDKLRQDPERGDPNRREEDRHAFLLSLLASRQHVCITFIGESEHDRQEQPPSTCVTDLVDSQVDAASKVTRDDVLQNLVWKHPQKAWSPRNFVSPLDPYAFDASAFAGAQSLVASTTANAPAPFVGGSAPTRLAEVTSASAQQIIEMLRAPQPRT